MTQRLCWLLALLRAEKKRRRGRTDFLCKEGKGRRELERAGEWGVSGWGLQDSTLGQSCPGQGWMKKRRERGEGWKGGGGTQSESKNEKSGNRVWKVPEGQHPNLSGTEGRRGGGGVCARAQDITSQLLTHTHTRAESRSEFIDSH